VDEFRLDHVLIMWDWAEAFIAAACITAFIVWGTFTVVWMWP